MPAAIAQLEPFIPYIALGALALSLISVGYAITLTMRLKRLALGKNGSIEESIAILLRESKDTKQFRTDLEKYLKHAEARLRGSIQGVGMVRFNPFVSGQGGNQSFSCAFLDERGNGVVLSTLYARDRVGVYAKPVENGASSFELSGEEQEAIAKAKASVAQNKK